MLLLMNGLTQLHLKKENNKVDIKNLKNMKKKKKKEVEKMINQVMKLIKNIIKEEIEFNTEKMIKKS